MTGEIRDFSKPAEKPQEPTRDVQILSSSDETRQGVEVDVRQHEQVVVSTDKLRHKPAKPGDPEIRIRVGDTREWDKVKRGEDE
jgi:hypothetical protein